LFLGALASALLAWSACAGSSLSGAGAAASRSPSSAQARSSPASGTVQPSPAVGTVRPSAASSATFSPRPGQLLPCSPESADEKQTPGQTPTPCISIDPTQNFRDNARYRERITPKPADVAALQAAASDLNRAFAELRAQGLFSDASVRQAISRNRSLDGAWIHPPASEELATTGATALVVLQHTSACLIGEHGPNASVVTITGQTRDGGCEALYGH
jgi:hypothetical protein